MIRLNFLHEAWNEETATLCRARVQSLLDYTANEKAFLDGVIERGQIDATLIDVDADFQGRIGRMPVLQWKAKYVRKNRSGG